MTEVQKAFLTAAWNHSLSSGCFKCRSSTIHTGDNYKHPIQSNPTKACTTMSVLYEANSLQEDWFCSTSLASTAPCQKQVSVMFESGGTRLPGSSPELRCRLKKWLMSAFIPVQATDSKHWQTSWLKGAEIGGCSVTIHGRRQHFRQNHGIEYPESAAATTGPVHQLATHQLCWLSSTPTHGALVVCICCTGWSGTQYALPTTTVLKADDIQDFVEFGSEHCTYRSLIHSACWMDKGTR